jgi:hypothetical protein
MTERAKVDIGQSLAGKPNARREVRLSGGAQADVRDRFGRNS